MSSCRWLWSLALFITIFDVSTAQGDLRFTVTGTQPGDEFGSIVSGAGDIDGDGHDDVIVGAPYDATAAVHAGKATIFSGRTGGVIREFFGTAANQSFGYSVCGLGDLNGDGVPEVMIGLSANGSTGLGPGGGAKVFSGADGSLLYTFAGQFLNDYFGLCMADLGDIDADGVSDMIVGTSIPPTSTLSGYARVYSGATGTLLHTFTGSFVGHRLGNAVANAHDVDGDGVNDIVVGAIGGNLFGGSTGSAFVYSGATFAQLYVFNGTSYQQHFGYSVAGVGDVNGDGRGDILVGTYRSNAMGYAKVYSGLNGATLWTLNGDVVGDAFGHTVASAGDVNGDGVPDFMVSAPNAHSGSVLQAGKVKIFSGAGATLLAARFGTFASMHLGYSFAAAGDVNGDQVGDVILGTLVPGTLGLPGRALTVSLLTAEAFAQNVGGTQSLSLAWQPGRPGQVGNGTAVTMGAEPGSIGVIAVSGGTGLAWFDLMPLVVDPASPAFSYFPVAYDGAGALSIPVNLRTPALAGVTIYAQAIAVDSLGVFSSSNGMMLYFGL